MAPPTCVCTTYSGKTAACSAPTACPPSCRPKKSAGLSPTSASPSRRSANSSPSPTAPAVLTTSAAWSPTSWRSSRRSERHALRVAPDPLSRTHPRGGRIPTRSTSQEGQIGPPIHVGRHMATDSPTPAGSAPRVTITLPTVERATDRQPAPSSRRHRRSEPRPAYSYLRQDSGRRRRLPRVRHARFARYRHVYVGAVGTAARAACMNRASCKERGGTDGAQPEP